MRKPYSFTILLIIHLLIYMIDGHGETVKLDFDDTKVYIVYLGERQHSDPKLIKNSHLAMLTTLMGSEQLALDSMVYSYRYGFSGFAAKLTQSQSQQLSDHPDVVRVIPNTFRKLQTTRSWDYLGVPRSNEPPRRDNTGGDGVIIGVLDSGIWPESKSFNDDKLSEIPPSWKGTCKSGDQFNATKLCNKKLIGARWFVDGLIADIGRAVNLTALGEFSSARDAVGHGTHVSSTAAGAAVDDVSYHGAGRGTARGGAPKARLAVYKVCWGVRGGFCADADILKGIDEAIKDGVHVLTMSIGTGSLPLYSEVDGHDPIAVGSFHAVGRGITVVCAAGNDGPTPQSVTNTAPWIITVAASTMDRAFATQITLGNNKTFQGRAIYAGKGVDTVGLVYPGDDATSTGVCENLGTIRRSLVAGKVVLCFTTFDTPYMTSYASSLVRVAGGVGVIVAKLSNEITAQCRGLPCAEVDYEVGTRILFYIRSTRNPMVKLSLSTTLVGKGVSAKIVGFSSRGPNSLAASVLKPDIAAPGVQIIAATSGLDTTSEQGFTMNSGTSMATPHITGIVALLRAQHPNWSPAAIRSALTTTGKTRDQYGIPIYAESNPPKLADPFDFGGGIVDPNGATCPGLIYDMDITDYINYLCSMEYDDSAISGLTGQTVTCPRKRFSVLDVNLPSIIIPHLRNSTTLTRRVTNVGAVDSIYHVVIEPPTGTLVFVYPPILIFNCNTKTISFKVTIIALHQLSAGYYFGSLTWTDGLHSVRSHIGVRTALPQELNVASI